MVNGADMANEFRPYYLRETVRTKCANCHSFAWADPVEPNGTCICGAIKIVNCEIVEGESEPFTHEEFLAAITEQ